ncbi:NERD domain-containing protein/DEAD/DEAH box helicase [Vreelandella titanicae]|uniref:NERD domain-containing protein/DEAD/DEAH box helicase n=1 Tax=Vreelandella titanicae TaxID=664683 RepID=UPI0016815316|nr:NERD domain-containing protein/DEAD/DEAH box helicase [Halomonas titanicae]QNU61543.1 NERD domain-containing protein/DEAD/DEAH box helicase [Halomonas titanicae]
MAEIYPRLSNAELEALPSRAEANVYRQLRALDFPGLEVMHSLATQTRNDKGTWVGEIDFLLFHPQYGIQLWEVKGGSVWLDGEGQWWSEGNNGIHKLTTTPLEQLKKQTGSLVQALNQVLPGTKLPIAPVLVFPDTRECQGNFPELTLNRNHVMLKGDLQAMRVEQLVGRFQNTAWAGRAAVNSLPLTKQQTTLIQHHLLRPAYAFATSVAEQARDVEAALFRLSEEQQWVLRLLEHIPRMAIYGGAGTGKSVLARMRAEQQAREGKKVLLLCFNIALAEAHRQAMADTQLGTIEIATFHELCQIRAEKAGFGWPVPEAPVDIPRFYNETAPDLLIEALQKMPEQWGALVVDEAQDYVPEWWLPLYEMLAEDASVTLLADPAQNLFARDCQLPLDVFDGMVPYPFTLHRNYRNAYEIACWLKERHGAAAEPGEHLPSSQHAVTVHAWKKPQDQWPLLKKAIAELKQDGFQPQDILLLIPFKVANSQVLQALMEHSPQYSERLFNVAAVKGLEAPMVMLVDLGASAWAENPKVEYVGVSRARVKIVVFTSAQSFK